MIRWTPYQSWQHTKGVLQKRALIILSIFLAVALCITVMSACGSEADDDATKSGQTVNKEPAEVIAMPDKFRNIAHKCDGHGHRVFSNSTGDSGTSSEVAVIDDPSCPGGRD